MLGSSRRIGCLSSNQTSPLRKEINNSLYLDTMQVVSYPFTRWSVTHQGVVDSLNHTGFTYEQTTDVFPAGSVVKNEENCSDNLTRYSNKPLIMNQLLILLMVFIRRVMLKLFKTSINTQASYLP